MFYLLRLSFVTEHHATQNLIKRRQMPQSGMSLEVEEQYTSHFRDTRAVRNFLKGKFLQNVMEKNFLPFLFLHLLRSLVFSTALYIDTRKNSAYGRQNISQPMRIVAPIPQQGGPRIPKNPIFLKNGKNHPKRKNSKTSRDMPILAIYPSTRGL